MTRTLTRTELTVALAARQLLLERARLAPAEALRRLTPVQGQEPSAPYIALAARLDGFSRDALEQDIAQGAVVKTTIMRQTLHLVAADEYPAYAQVARRAPLRSWQRRYDHLDEERVVSELGAWLTEPRTNGEIVERVRRYDGVPAETWAAVFFARTLLPLVQVPPAGFWGARRHPRFVADPRPRPDPAEAATHVLERYLAAFGPASRRDVASWAGAAQRDFACAFQRLPLVTYRDERGTELLDLPGAPLPPASTRLPVRLLARWDQALLAHKDRERIMPPELEPLRLTLSGDQTVLVDGRVAASWSLERARRSARVVVTPHTDIPRRALRELREEADRIARFAHPDAERVELVT